MYEARGTLRACLGHDGHPRIFGHACRATASTRPASSATRTLRTRPGAHDDRVRMFSVGQAARRRLRHKNSRAGSRPLQVNSRAESAGKVCTWGRVRITTIWGVRLAVDRVSGQEADTSRHATTVFWKTNASAFARGGGWAGGPAESFGHWAVVQLCMREPQFQSNGALQIAAPRLGPSVAGGTCNATS